MVFFTCNHCGESLKKQAVEKHGWRCKREIDVCCVDCHKDFYGTAYTAHTSCITEEEKYSGKDYVPKANANKGAKKQEAWLETIRSITDRKKNLPKGISDVFNVIRNNDNIPRKKKGFMNFFQNSAKYIRTNDVDAAWSLLEEEVKRNNDSANQNQANGTVPNGSIKTGNGTIPNGSNMETNQTSSPQENGLKKRKLDETEDQTIKAEPASKKAKKKFKDQPIVKSEENENLVNVSAVESDSTAAPQEGKFKWKEAILSTLGTKNNEMKLNKLRKKVLKRYQQFKGCGVDTGDKIERKFSKKITKLGLVVDNETVRLLD
ncbi:cell growth-regulating nucleolar protein [Malaya genurostris]|uniref:cell growth-regulating nucleolar protein n=1 Tax=Malaya genurostris TaxID=325434 RepID=UPI0026F3B3F9|nr:cell growth-regulating nucleolar protein [Malaya genurostris]